MSSSNISRGEPVGAVQDRLSRRFELEAKYLSDNAQCEPVKVLFGRDALSMTQLTPIFDIKTKKGGSSKGKSAGAANITYFGGFAIAYCVGKAYSIYKIWNGDDEIWSSAGQFGQILGETGIDWNADQKYNEITIPKYGTLRVYQGCPDQLVDQRFWDYDNDQPKSILIDGSVKPNVMLTGPWSAFQNIFYIVSDYFRLGTSNTTPNIRVELQVVPTLFAEDMGGSESIPAWNNIRSDLKINGIPVFDAQGDTYAPLVIYEYLRNSTWGGAGLAADAIDKDSFLDALAVCVAEGIAISPCVDEDSSIRNAISQLLEYIDGILYLTDAGKVALKCVRTPENLDNVPEIDEDQLVDEPKINLAGSDDTWGRTLVSFNSRVDDYESTSTGFDSPRYIDYALDEIKVKEVNLPYVKQRLIASKLARRLGNAGATPGCEVELSVLPSVASQYHVGDLIKLSYAKFGLSNLLLKINSITLGSPMDPSVTISAVNQVETDWEIEVDEDSLESGYPSKSTGIVETPGGFLKPYVLGMYGDFGGRKKNQFTPYQCVAFVEASDVVTSYTFSAFQAHTGSAEESQSDRWSCYQVKVKIRDWGVSKNDNWNEGRPFLWIEFETEGNNRKEALETVFSSNNAYITACAYKNPTFNENYQNSTRTLLPMTFTVLPVNYEGDQYYEPGYSVVPTVDSETGVFVYKLKVYCAEFISGSTYPDTLSNNKFYPSQTAFVYIHYTNGTPSVAQFVGTQFDRKYILSGSLSYLRVNSVLTDGRVEEKGGFFLQTYYSNNHTYTHLVSHDLNDVADPFDTSHYVDAWGLPVKNSDGNITLGNFESGQVQPASDDEDPMLFIDNERGSIYYFDNGDKTLLEEFDVFNPPIALSQLPEHNHDDRYQRIGESAERYYVYREDSTEFQHESGQCGLLHVHITSDTEITLPIPAASTAEDGDVITIIVTKDNNSTLNYITLSNTEDFFNTTENNTLKCATGEVSMLVCTNNKWLIIQTSQLK